MAIASNNTLENLLPIILECCRQSTEDDSIEGVVVFGSYLRCKRDTLSDIDLLVVLQKPRSIHRMVRCGATTLDIHSYTAIELSDQLSTSKWRNNVPLLALCRGYCLFDQTGSVKLLQTKARILWEARTGLVPASEVATLIATLPKLEYSVSKLIMRAARNTENSSLVCLILLQLHSLYSSAVMIYLRCFAAWAYPLWVLDQLEEPLYKSIAFRSAKALVGNDVATIGAEILYLCKASRQQLEHDR